MFVCLYVCLSVSPSLPLVSFGQLFRCADNCIVNIMKVYIERNNMQAELIQFRKKILTLFMLTFAKRGINAISPTERISGRFKLKPFDH